MSRRHRCLADAWFATLLWVPSLLAADELSVIHEYPNSRPISEFLGPVARRPRPPTTSAPIPLGVGDIESLLPIRSPGLTPGAVATRHHTVPFVQPFFLIGSDALSRDWLQRHRQELITMGAVGLLVEAETVEDLEVTAELAQGLTILPVSATDISSALRLPHYPVCITPRRVWQ